MAEIKSLPKPGNYSLDDIVIHTNLEEGKSEIINLRNMFTTVSITSSIHLKAMKITINVMDEYGIFEHADLLGDELISVRWKTPDYFKKESPEREMFFRIVNIQNVTPNETIDGYNFTITGVSELFYYQSFANITGHMSGTVKSMVENVFEEAIKSTTDFGDGLALSSKSQLKNASDTLGVIDINIPSETPFDTMDYLLAWASDNASSMYFFYQRLDGYFFDSLNDIVRFQPNREITFTALKNSHRLRLDPFRAAESFASPKTAVQKIMDFNQIQRNGTFALADEGALHNTVATVDYVKKTVDRKSNKFSEVMLEAEPLGMSEPPYLQTTKNYFEKFEKESNSTDFFYLNSGQVNAVDATESIIKRKILGKSLFNNLISCKIYGRSDLDVGDIVNLNVVKTDVGKSAKVDDPVMSGFFLVKDLVHTFTPNGYHQGLTLCRTGSDEYKPSENESEEEGSVSIIFNDGSTIGQGGLTGA